MLSLRKNMFALLVALLLPTTCVAAGKAVGPIEQGIKAALADVDQPAKPAMTAAKVVRVEKEWTIMTFINGKNNLEKYAYMDVNEMEMVGSDDKTNVVVELGVPSGSKRMLVVKDNDFKTITSPAVATFTKADMGDYKHLIDFIKWAKATYPAKHYMVNVWNHGAGWLKGAKNKGISYDDETGNHITTVQLGQALAAVGGVDIYSSDACLMQMAEVVAELAPYAKYIVGSEESEGGDGYTYNTFLTNLPSDPKELAVHCAKMANENYSSDSTQSVIDTSKMDKFPVMMDKWVGTVMANLSTTTVKMMARQSQAYAYADNKDLVDFMSKLNVSVAEAVDAQVAELRASKAPESEIAKVEKQKTRIAKAGDNLLEYITKDLIVANFTSENMKKSHGLAVYIPNYAMDKSYADLQWAQNSKWPDFLKWMNAK